MGLYRVRLGLYAENEKKVETTILGYMAFRAPSSHDTQNQRATETPCACYDDPIAALKFFCTLGVSSGIMEGKDGEGELLCKDSVWLGGVGWRK